VPSWTEVLALLLRPKPSLRCAAYAIGKTPVRIAYRRGGSWVLDDGATDVARVGWLAAAIEPWRHLSLPGVEGHVTGREDVGGRRALIVEARGLRGPTVVSKVWVDEGTGVIVRIERLDDPAPLLVLEGLEVGATSD
jgi:hypothetical protein